MTSIVGVGLDAVELPRMRAVLERTPRMRERAFTDDEREYCLGKRDPTERFAARFAAKEAVLKVLGESILRMALRDIEVVRDDTGKPGIVLHGRMAQRAGELGITSWQLSLTHTEHTASAVAVGLRDERAVADAAVDVYDRKRNAAAALLFDGEGRLLVVRPTYEKGWTLPGGAVDAGESPRRGCEREVLEEIGLRRWVGRLLAVEWRTGAGGARGEAMLWIFDGGTLSADEIDRIALPADELSAWDLVAVDKAIEMIREGSAAKARRVRAALDAMAGTTVAWLDDGVVVDGDPGPA